MNAIASVDRRAFVGSTALALAAVNYERIAGANARIGVGFIGFGLIGKRHVLDFRDQPDADLVAVCDVHRGRLHEALALLEGSARGYADFRQLLDEKDVDAVVVSTPDHWHGLMTMLACAAGKDVYVEKPLSLFVREGRWMVEVAERTRRVVQVGTQQRSGRHYHRACDLVRGGHLGKVVSVRMHAYRNIMPGFGRPSDQVPPPELDWQLWLGPAPLRQYNPNRSLYHFRWFWDYSGGQMTNLGSHSLDVAHWYLNAKGPLAVTSVGGRFCLDDNGETPDTQDVLFEYPGWTAVWSHREGARGSASPFGLEFIGCKGSLTISRRGFTVTGDRKMVPANAVPRFGSMPPVGAPVPVQETEPPEHWTTSLQDNSGSEQEQFTGHVRNFLDCIKSRQRPLADLESGHRVATACHLANLSLRLGRRIRWDAEKETVVGDPEAAGLLIRPYRPPWDRELQALGVS